MSGYVIAQIKDIKNNEIYKKYVEKVTPIVEKFGGKFLIRGGELEGLKIYELFSSGSPFNFNEFKEKKGSTTQTLLNNIDVIIHNKGKNLVNLFVRRSFSEHLFSWINDSASRL